MNRVAETFRKKGKGFGGPTRGECMRHASDLTIPAVREMARPAL